MSHAAHQHLLQIGKEHCPLLNEIVSNEENLYQEKYKTQKLFKHNESIENYLERLKKKELEILKFQMKCLC